MLTSPDLYAERDLARIHYLNWLRDCQAKLADQPRSHLWTSHNESVVPRMNGLPIYCTATEAIK